MKKLVLILCFLGLYQAKAQPVFELADFPNVTGNGYFSLADCDSGFVALMHDDTGHYAHWNFNNYNITVHPNDSVYAGFVPFQFDNNPLNTYNYAFPTIEELGPTVYKNQFSYSVGSYLDTINDTLYLCRRQSRASFSQRVPRIVFPLNYGAEQSFETLNESPLGNSVLFSKAKYDGFGRVSTPWEVFDSVYRIKLELLEQRGSHEINITAYYWVQKNSGRMIARLEVLEEPEDYLIALYLNRLGIENELSLPGRATRVAPISSFPNPATGELSLNLPGQIAQLQVMDMFGKIHLRSAANRMPLNVQFLLPGRYAVLVYDAQGILIGNAAFLKL